MHAMGPNVAGVIGSAIAAGVLDGAVRLSDPSDKIIPKRFLRLTLRDVSFSFLNNFTSEPS